MGDGDQRLHTLEQAPEELWMLKRGDPEGIEAKLFALGLSKLMKRLWATEGHVEQH